jgi:hypothetical protein
MIDSLVVYINDEWKSLIDKKLYCHDRNTQTCYEKELQMETGDHD